MPDMERQIKNRIEAFIRDISELARQAVQSKLAKAAKGKPAKGRGRSAAPPPPARGGKRGSKKATTKRAGKAAVSKASVGKRGAKKTRGQKSTKAAKKARKA